MRVGYFSDLHTELLRSAAALTPKDLRIGRAPTLEAFGEGLREAYREASVIVAAGDIGMGAKAVSFLANTFPDKDVIYTPGNHDYWTGEIYSTQREMRQAAGGTRVHFLPDGETVEINGVLFCGATLWTDYELAGNAKAAMADAAELMNDFRLVRLRRHSAIEFRKDEVPARLHAIDLLGFHRQHVERIRQAMALSAERDMPLVVATHHAPSALSLLFYGEREAFERSGVRGFGYEESDPCYASHLDHLMQGPCAPQVWIHGHTHIAAAYQVGLCRVVSNPKGYSEGDETGWEAGRVIEVRIGE